MILEEFVKPATQPTQYTTWSCDELRQIPPQVWRVKGLLPQSGVAFVYGDSQSGKTFLVIDLALTIASDGGHWFGHKVKPAKVLYVPLEDVPGIALRVNAWHAHHEQQACENFFVVCSQAPPARGLPWHGRRCR